MKRRALLRGILASAGAAALGPLVFSRKAYAFGETPPGYESATVPQDMRAHNVLEILLFGGLSPYESFYAMPDYGAADGSQWYSFYNSSNNDLETAVEGCGYKVQDWALLQPFAVDSNGSRVHLGPFAMPFRDRPDLLERLRLVVTAHEAAPHEVAIPLALSGRRIGHPRLAGLGAHIQRYYQQLEGAQVPYSFVLLPASQIQVELVAAATARGLHPSAARPISLKLTAASALEQLLDRTTVGANAPAYDALITRQIERYRERLKWNRTGNPLRAVPLDQLSDASTLVANSPELKAMLGQDAFLPPPPGVACGSSVDQNTVVGSVDLAVHLLTNAKSPARYVCVVDGGFIPVPTAAGGYDTHDYTCSIQARNLNNVLTSLALRINAPGEKDPQKLDLDKTMIVLTSEFGRTPTAVGSLGGRGHWPGGYPTMMLGGPIASRPSALGGNNGAIFGGMGADAKATESADPTEIRAAILMALGIWPFENEAYNVSDIAYAADQLDGAHRLLNILGVGS